jgi:hypothetical protein
MIQCNSSRCSHCGHWLCAIIVPTQHQLEVCSDVLLFRFVEMVSSHFLVLRLAWTSNISQLKNLVSSIKFCVDCQRFRVRWSNHSEMPPWSIVLIISWGHGWSHWSLDVKSEMQLQYLALTIIDTKWQRWLNWSHWQQNAAGDDKVENELLSHYSRPVHCIYDQDRNSWALHSDNNVDEASKLTQFQFCNPQANASNLEMCVVHWYIPNPPHNLQRAKNLVDTALYRIECFTFYIRLWVCAWLYCFFYRDMFLYLLWLTWWCWEKKRQIWLIHNHVERIVKFYFIVGDYILQRNRLWRIWWLKKTHATSP